MNTPPAFVQTEAGTLVLTRAGLSELPVVLGLIRESAGWIKGKGLSQWEAYLSEKGPTLVEKRFSEGEVYLAALDKKPVATFCLQWQDPFIWDEKGLDQQAGYIHALAVQRKLAGKHVGKQLMAWAESAVTKHQRRYLRLDCMAENDDLFKYYEGLGFQWVDSKKGDQWEIKLLEKRVLQEPLRFPKR
jgi:ribosomal protein S18 acetylase RimI-like enzyme